MDGSGLTELNITFEVDGNIIAVNRKEKRLCITAESKRRDITAIDMAYVHMRLV